MTLAHLYSRYSSDIQSQGDSLRRQLQLAQDYCRTHNLILADPSEYVDKGISAFRGKNAELGKLKLFMDRVKSGEITPGSYCLAESIDRISRASPLEALDIIRKLVYNDVQFVELNSGKLYSRQLMDADPMLGLMLHVSCIRAHEESTRKAGLSLANRKRVLAELESGKRRVYHYQCPRWLEVDRERDVYVQIPDRVVTVQRIFCEYTGGVKLKTIAKALNADRVPTFAGARFWRDNSVKKLLGNICVTGTLIPRHDGKQLEPRPNHFPRVIADDLFHKAQRLLAGTHTRNTPHSIKNLLAGLVKCHLCGSAMTRDAKSEERDWVYLNCIGRKNKSGCQAPHIRYTPFIRAFLDVIPSIVKVIETEHPGLPITVTVAAVKHKVLQKKVKETVQLLYKEDSPALREELRRLELEAAEIEAVLKQLQVKRASSGRENVEARLKALMLDINNDTLRDCLSSISVRPVGDKRSELTLHWHHIVDSTKLTLDWPY